MVGVRGILAPDAARIDWRTMVSTWARITPALLVFPLALGGCSGAPKLCSDGTCGGSGGQSAANEGSGVSGPTGAGSGTGLDGGHAGFGGSNQPGTPVMISSPDGGAAGCIRTAAPVACSPSCGQGFHCSQGTCILNGDDGLVQVTLRWDQPEDLDLHLVEPQARGPGCEIWYGDRGGASGSTCGAIGWLDLDSNAGCGIDNVDTENIIYAPGVSPPSGTYLVRVDYFENCTAMTAIPFEVTVRVGHSTSSFCGTFRPSDADFGGTGSGMTITSFVVP